MIKDSYIALLSIISAGIFLLGMILWPIMPKEHIILGKLYYITGASVLYILSLIIFMLAHTRWMKISSCILLSVFSINLYVELFLDPLNWTKWDFGLIIVVGVKLFLVVSIIERIKQKRNDNSNN